MSSGSLSALFASITAQNNKYIHLHSRCGCKGQVGAVYVVIHCVTMVSQIVVNTHGVVCARKKPRERRIYGLRDCRNNSSALTLGLYFHHLKAYLQGPIDWHILAREWHAHLAISPLSSCRRGTRHAYRIRFHLQKGIQGISPSPLRDCVQLLQFRS